MTIPNTKYRVSRKKTKHYNTCNNNNCIEQPFKNNTQWSGDEKRDETGVRPPIPPVSAHCGYQELKTRVCGTHLKQFRAQEQCC